MRKRIWALGALVLTMGFLSSAAWAGAGDFGFAEFKALLDHQHPQSVAEVVRLLPASFRAKAVLITDSGSLQLSAPTAPRVAFYGSGDFVLTFNGSPSQQGFETIETARFDSSSHAFTFEEFVFPKDLAARKAFVLDRLKAKDPGFSQFDLDELEKRQGRQGPNPALCLQCHESGAHPLLPVYPQGPALLGGYQGYAQAPAWLPELKENLASNERYQGSPELLDLVDSFSTGAPQREFNAALAWRNWQRVAAVLRKEKSFGTFRAALYGALAGCAETASLLPAGSLAEKLRVDSAPGRSSLTEQEESLRLQNVRLLVEEGLGILMAENFSTSVGFESYDFSSALGGIEALLPALWSQDSLAKGPAPFGAGFCQGLKR